MKWGRKKPSSSLSNSIFFSPFSWISRFKKMTRNLESKSTVGDNLSSIDPTWNQGRSYSRDEAYWRLSFEDEKKIRGGLKSVWYDSDEELKFPLHNPKCLKQMKVRKSPQSVKIMQGNEFCKGEIEEECKFEATNLKENTKMKEEKIEMPRRSFYLNRGSTRHRAKQGSKRKDGKLMNAKKRKYVYLNMGSSRNRAKQGNKTKACSVRMAAKIECKISAPEIKKMSKSKIKKVTEERTARSKLAVDTFAVVKSSHDPEQDFVDSMVEMITEKGIRRPEELEELLACYLTLNHDEYHDLIIRVFRKVWCDLNPVSFDRDVQREEHFIL